MTAPLRICLVCSGNICRSPSAAAVLRRLLADAGLAVTVDSAGTGDWHAGEPIDPRAAAALTRRGYPTEHEARQFRPEDLADYDLVLALDRSHVAFLRGLGGDPEARGRIRLLREFDPAAGEDLDIPDPYFEGRAGFEHVLDLIEAACRGLVADLDRERAERRTGS